MEILRLTPFQAGVIVWQAQSAAPSAPLSLTTIVKGTFLLAPGEATLAPDQIPLMPDRHWDENPLASLWYAGDFAPVKRRVDVMLTGHAYAPNGAPAAEVVARMRVGEIVKALRVTGDRMWMGGSDGQLVAGRPVPFTAIPLRYERAELSADNPVGKDPHGPPIPLALAAPNLALAEGTGAACFGPIAPTWRARRNLLDEMGRIWTFGVSSGEARIFGPPPPAMEFSFFNAAPREQQIDLLRAGAPIELHHLHPEHATLATRLPPIRPQVFRVSPGPSGERVEEIIVRADTLWIDADRGVAQVVWRGVSELDSVIERWGRLVIAADPDGKKLRWDRIARELAGASRASFAARAEVEPLDVDPLARRHDSLKSQRDAARSEHADAPPPIMPRSEIGWPHAPIAAPAPVAPAAIEDEESTTTTTGAAIDVGRSVDAMEADTVKRRRFVAPIPGSDRPPRAEPAAAKPYDKSAPASGEPGVVDPPTDAQAAWVATPHSRAAQSPEEAQPAIALPSDDLPLDRYAAISAELAHRRTERATVLREQGLDERRWSSIDRAWKKALAESATRRDRDLMAAFDAAYVAAQDRLRAPVGVVEYARILVGLERGEVGKVLADLKLQLSDLMRLQRVWSRRTMESPPLAAELHRELDAQRRQGR